MVAAITDNPKSMYERTPRDLDRAANRRFLLVTPDNLQQIGTTYPDIFRGGYNDTKEKDLKNAEPPAPAAGVPR